MLDLFMQHPVLYGLALLVALAIVLKVVKTSVKIMVVALLVVALLLGIMAFALRDRIDADKTLGEAKKQAAQAITDKMKQGLE